MNREYYELKDCNLLLAMTGNSNIYHLDVGYKPKTMPDHKVIYTFNLTNICTVLGNIYHGISWHLHTQNVEIHKLKYLGKTLKSNYGMISLFFRNYHVQGLAKLPV